MMYPIEWTSEALEANLIIILLTIGFLIFRIVQQSEKLYATLVQRYGEERGQELRIYIQRAVGVVFYGIIPALVLFTATPYRWADYGVAAKFPLSVWLWTIGLSVLFIFLTRTNTKKPESLAMYPEVRAKVWTPRILRSSAFWWTAYLVAYELMFRGFLLFACARAFGAVPAIIINTSLYSLVHVPKGLTEGIGAIPLGLALCLITFQTETIWVAVLVHIVMSLANEWYSLKYNPNMEYRR